MNTREHPILAQTIEFAKDKGAATLLRRGLAFPQK